MKIVYDRATQTSAIQDDDGVLHAQPLVRTPFNYDRNLVSRATALDMRGMPTRTQINQQEDADINTIVRRFGLTGQLPDNVRQPEYQDYEGVFDFQTAMNAVLKAEEEFMQLPADMRFRFNNDPQSFLAFCENPANIEEGRKLGIFRPAPEAMPDAPKPTPEAPPQGGTSTST